MVVAAFQPAHMLDLLRVLSFYLGLATALCISSVIVELHENERLLERDVPKKIL